MEYFQSPVLPKSISFLDGQNCEGEIPKLMKLTKRPKDIEMHSFDIPKCKCDFKGYSWSDCFHSRRI